MVMNDCKKIEIQDSEITLARSTQSETEFKAFKKYRSLPLFHFVKFYEVPPEQNPL